MKNNEAEVVFEVENLEDNVKLQGISDIKCGKEDTNCNRPGGFLWGSNSKSTCSC